MGIKGCKKGGEVLWEAKNLTLKTLKMFQCGSRIDVDGNALAWSLHHSSKSKAFGQIIHKMADDLMNIAFSGGFQITIIVDGNLRPDCKRDSWSREKNREVDDVSRIFCRMKAMALFQKVKSGNASSDEELDYEKLKKTVKALESKCASSCFKIPDDFHEQLSQKLMALGACVPNANGGFVSENVLKAMFQADSVIMHRAIQGKSDFILSKDSDFPALIGKKCILLTKIVPEQGVKVRGRKRKKDKNAINTAQHQLKDASTFKVEIAGSNNLKMMELRSKLASSNENEKIEWIEAKYPLFKYNNPTLRATIAVAMGSDVYKQGVKGLSYKTIHELIKKISTEQNFTDEEYEPRLLAYLKQALIQKTKPKLSDAFYDSLVYALMYEPGIVLNEGGSYCESGAVASGLVVQQRAIKSSDYIFGPPPKPLPMYLKEFASNEESVDQSSSSQICKCKGTSSF